MREFKRMKSNVGPNNEEMEYLYSAKDTLESLITQGVLDKHGNPVVKRWEGACWKSMALSEISEANYLSI